MKTDNVLLPLAGAGIVLLLATGGLSRFKSWLQGWVTSGATDAFSQSTSPFVPVSVGQGGDLAVITPSSSSSVGTSIGGTYNPSTNMFTTSGYLQFPNPTNPGQTVAGYSNALQGKSFQVWGNNGPYNTNPSQGGLMLQPSTGFGGDIITLVNGMVSSLTPTQVQTLVTAEQSNK